MKLAPREKVLAMAVGGMVFVLVNLLILRAFARQSATLRSDLAQQRLEWATMQDVLSDQDPHGAPPAMAG